MQENFQKKRHRIALFGVEEYDDKYGNKIICNGNIPGVKVIFRGSNNTLELSPGCMVNDLRVEFHGNDGVVKIGDSQFKGFIRIGSGSQVTIGDAVTCANRTFIAASEGAKVVIGNDCMFASEIQIRTDDVHSIYDVRSGKRLNPPKNVTIGNHVWLAWGVKILGGSTIGDGCVVGMDSLVKSEFSNNCILAGTPAKVTRQDIAWERPVMFVDWNDGMPQKSKYWDLTK